jgi:hypothetical protein
MNAVLSFHSRKRRGHHHAPAARRGPSGDELPPFLPAAVEVHHGRAFLGGRGDGFDHHRGPVAGRGGRDLGGKITAWGAAARPNGVASPLSAKIPRLGRVQRFLPSWKLRPLHLEAALVHLEGRQQVIGERDVRPRAGMRHPRAPVRRSSCTGSVSMPGK